MLFFTSITHMIPSATGNRVHEISYHYHEFATAEDAQESYKDLAFEAKVWTRNITPTIEVKTSEYWVCYYDDPDGNRYCVTMWEKEEEA